MNNYYIILFSKNWHNIGWRSILGVHIAYGEKKRNTRNKAVAELGFPSWWGANLLFGKYAKNCLKMKEIAQ